MEKQSEKPEQRKIYQKVVYELLRGENLSTAMEKQGDKFPTLLVNMIKKLWILTRSFNQNCV